ncbi:MAG: amino acid permease, partial [Simkaniaceae bacterium]|nr:amino acid permease [Simkaniaceae bacterium]
LRYKSPNTPRPYKIPGGNAGMWITSIIGLAAVTFCFIVGFYPPESLQIENLFFFEAFLIIGIALFCAIPFIILAFKKKSWKTT